MTRNSRTLVSARFRQRLPPGQRLPRSWTSLGECHIPDNASCPRDSLPVMFPQCSDHSHLARFQPPKLALRHHSVLTDSLPITATHKSFHSAKWPRALPDALYTPYRIAIPFGVDFQSCILIYTLRLCLEFILVSRHFCPDSDFAGASTMSSDRYSNNMYYDYAYQSQSSYDSQPHRPMRSNSGSSSQSHPQSPQLTSQHHPGYGHTPTNSYPPPPPAPAPQQQHQPQYATATNHSYQSSSSPSTSAPPSSQHWPPQTQNSWSQHHQSYPPPGPSQEAQQQPYATRPPPAPAPAPVHARSSSHDEPAHHRPQRPPQVQVHRPVRTWSTTSGPGQAPSAGSSYTPPQSHYTPPPTEMQGQTQAALYSPPPRPRSDPASRMYPPPARESSPREPYGHGHGHSQPSAPSHSHYRATSQHLPAPAPSQRVAPMHHLPPPQPSYSHSQPQSQSQSPYSQSQPSPPQPMDHGFHRRRRDSTPAPIPEPEPSPGPGPSMYTLSTHANPNPYAHAHSPVATPSYSNPSPVSAPYSVTPPVPPPTSSIPSSSTNSSSIAHANTPVVNVRPRTMTPPVVPQQPIIDFHQLMSAYGMIMEETRTALGADNAQQLRGGGGPPIATDTATINRMMDDAFQAARTLDKATSGNKGGGAYTHTHPRTSPAILQTQTPDLATHPFELDGRVFCAGPGGASAFAFAAISAPAATADQA
ncbi:GATA-type domain-containing protein [Mycena kentingensis (nom. inval.)]|nr:GATA-type domain-containing protein [Mycena kentingensis (nom. inval.)]